MSKITDGFLFTDHLVPGHMLRNTSTPRLLLKDIGPCIVFVYSTVEAGLVADPGGLVYHPGFFACQFENSYGPAFSRTLQEFLWVT